MCRFDWYQGTVLADPKAILAALGAIPGGLGRWEHLPRVPQGYGVGSRLLDGSGALAQVWWGGVHEYPHVVSSGESAQLVSDVLRSEFEHRVSRADACMDFADAGAYERLQGISLHVAERCRVRVDTKGDHLLRREGRTLYLGSPSSHTRLRVYEKADELRAKFRHDPVKLATVPAELARLECQVRPQSGQAKAAAARAAPLELMGSARWMRELMREVSGADLQPWQAGKPWRQADDDRAYAAMLAQYGGMLERMRGDHGTWDLVGRQIGDDLAERVRVRGRA